MKKKTLKRCNENKINKQIENTAERNKRLTRAIKNRNINKQKTSNREEIFQKKSKEKHNLQR